MTKGNTPAAGESTCGACGQTDNHPKHAVHVGVATVFDEQTFHPHDTNQDGWVEYHLDCPHKFADALDPAHVEAAKGGVHGDELRALITGEGN